MKLIMHILKSNPRLSIDNEKLSFNDILDKLKEEYIEVVEATYTYSKVRSTSKLKELVGEIFDLIQVCILLLWKCNIQAVTLDNNELIKDVNIDHKDKLIDRGWIIKTGIEIDVKE
ncbi:MAG: hypothetical protein RR891_02675 [Clostridium sp.]